MGVFSGIASVLIAGFMVWLLYRAIKHQPEAFSSKNISRSLSTLGVLGLILIGIIGFVVMLLRQ